MYGKFRRSFAYTEGAIYRDVFNYDRENLICYDNSIERKEGEVANNQSCYFIISKQDGSITRDIKISFKKIKSPIAISADRQQALYLPNNYPIIPYQGNWILRECSSDTIFRYLPDHSKIPFIVRTPSIQSMNIEIFLFLNILTDRYYFMEAVKKEYDLEKRRGYTITNVMYDKQEKAFFEHYVYNGDFLFKKGVYMNLFKPVNHEIVSWQSLEADELVESYENGKLTGKLKEIAANLEEESNPVIMLVKYKK